MICTECNDSEGAHHFECSQFNRPRLTPEQVGAQLRKSRGMDCGPSAREVLLATVVRELTTGRYTAAEMVALAQAALGQGGGE